MARKKTPIASINRPKRPRPGPPGGYLPVPFTGAAATGAQVPAGFVRFWAPGYPEHAVMVPMGDRGWITPHAVGWEGQQRPFGAALPSWKGYSAFEPSVDIVMERWSTQESIQPAYDLLIGLMNHGPDPVTNILEAPPPIMVTRGAANSMVTTPRDDARRYVITAVELDDEATVRGENDQLVRVEATVRLMQHVEVRSLRDSAATIRGLRRKNKPKRRKPYKSKSGDTLINIAGSQLHDRSRWPELKKLNPKIRDPRAKIPADTLIRLP